MVKIAGMALDKANKQEAADTPLRILDSGPGKLVKIAETVQEEAKERLKGKLLERNEDVQYNKGRVQRMAQLRLKSCDPERA